MLRHQAWQIYVMKSESNRKNLIPQDLIIDFRCSTRFPYARFETSFFCISSKKCDSTREVLSDQLLGDAKIRKITFTGFSGDDWEWSSSETCPPSSASLLSSDIVSPAFLRFLLDTLVSFAGFFRFVTSDFCIFPFGMLFFLGFCSSSSSSSPSSLLSEESELSSLLTFLDALLWKIFLTFFLKLTGGLSSETSWDCNTW